MCGNMLYRLIYSEVLQSAQFYLFMWLFWRTPSTLKRTSDSLNEELPIKKKKEKSFKKKDSFSIKKIVESTLELSAKAFFSLDKYLLKNMGRKPSFCYSIYRETKKFY